VAPGTCSVPTCPRPPGRPHRRVAVRAPVGFFFYSPFLGLACAVTVGLAFGLASAFGRVREPSRVRITFRGRGTALLRRLTASLLVGFAAAPVLGPVNGIVLAGVFALALAAQVLLNSAPDETTAASPARSLQQDRGGALLLGAVLLFRFSIVAIVLISVSIHEPTTRVTISTWLIDIVVSGIGGAVMGGFLFGRIGAIAAGLAAAIVGALVAGFAGIEYRNHDQAVVIVYTVLWGIAIGVSGVLTRAWGAFTFTRFWLALRGRLPLRLMRFLHDAHRRGVLRQSGTRYQFRHEHLHNHIASARRRA